MKNVWTVQTFFSCISAQPRKIDPFFLFVKGGKNL